MEKRKKYIIDCGEKRGIVASVLDDYNLQRRAPESAVEALREYARRRGLAVSSLVVDAKTRGEICAECYLQRYGAFMGHAVAVLEG